MVPMNTFAQVVGGIGGSGGVTQTISQSNSISASNSGQYGQVSASGNTQTNIGANVADVHIGSSGTGTGGVPGMAGSGDTAGMAGTGSGSHSTNQNLEQSNSIDASNTGTGGLVVADNNTQTNIGINAAHIRVGSSSGSATQGLMGWLGSNSGSGSHGTTTQNLEQANTITANNTGDNGAVSASNNIQTNFGINAAHIRVGSIGSTGSFSQGLTGWLTGNNGNNGGESHGTTTQNLGQSNSIDASNSGTHGTVLADNNVQTHIGINAAHLHIPNLQNLQNQLGQILGR